jgi:hypothetical protein
MSQSHFLTWNRFPGGCHRWASKAYTPCICTGTPPRHGGFGTVVVVVVLILLFFFLLLLLLLLLFFFLLLFLFL